MSDQIDLYGPRFGRADGARELIILLHGLGADGSDLIALAPVFARALPYAAFVAPNAPFPCDMAPFGHQWFSFQVKTPADVLAGIENTAPMLNAFIDKQLAAHGLGEERLALVGFSQGSMMALHVALRRARACAAVVAYSGALIGPERLPTEIKSRPPVLLVHGEADDVVPFPAMAAAEEALRANGVAVRSQGLPGVSHGIDEVGADLGTTMLKQSLYPEPPGSEDPS